MINLKVFLLKKSIDEREIFLFRGATEIKYVSKIDIKEQSPFNYLSITNPSDSNCICTLHSLQLKSNDKKSLILLMNDQKINCSKEIKNDIFKIGYDFKDNINSKFMELSTIINNDNLLADNYIILVPGGTLILSFQESVNETHLSITYNLENF